MSRTGPGLFIFDTLPSPQCPERLKALSSEWALFPFTPDEAVWSETRNLLEQEGLKVTEILPVAELLDKTAWSARPDYVEFVSSVPERRLVPGRSVGAYFKCPSQGFSAWWFSLVAEKNPLRSDAYHNLIKLLTILNICRDSGFRSIAFECENRALCEGLRNQQKLHGFRLYTLAKGSYLWPIRTYCAALYSTLRTFHSLLKRWWTIRRYRKEVKSHLSGAEDASLFVVTYFPHLDPDALEKGRFANRYCVPLQRALGEREKKEVFWLALPQDMNGYAWKDSLSLGKQIVENGYRFRFQEEWLTLPLLIRVLRMYGVLCTRFFRHLRALRSAFCFGPSSLDVWPIFRREWARSFAGSVLAQGLVHFTLFDACLKSLKPSGRLIYLSENVTWEKALCLAAERRSIPTAGIQHTSVPIQYPSQFYFSLQQGGRNSPASAGNVPMPDYLLCGGEIPADLHRAFGFPAERIVEWGAVRYQHLRDLHPTPWSERGNLVVVAGTVVPEETEELLKWVWCAFGEGVSFKVVLKGHYACPLEPILNRLGLELPEGFEIQKTPIDRLLRRARALIVTSSTCAIEGIATGCPIVVPKLMSIVDMCPLSGISELPIYAWSAEDLRRKAEGLVIRKTSPLDLGHCRRFVERYFRFVETDREFLEGVMSLDPLPHSEECAA